MPHSKLRDIKYVCSYPFQDRNIHFVSLLEAYLCLFEGTYSFQTGTKQSQDILESRRLEEISTAREKFIVTNMDKQLIAGTYTYVKGNEGLDFWAKLGISNNII